jgi:hypothetical protein
MKFIDIIYHHGYHYYCGYGYHYHSLLLFHYLFYDGL